MKSRNPEILTSFYCSIVRPKLEYAVPVWCAALSTQQDTLERVQRHFTHFCLGLPRKASTNSINEIQYSDKCTQLGVHFFK